LRDLRGSEIAMIYQEPMASLNPAMKIGKQLMEVPMIHEGVGEKEAYKRALEVVTDVRLPDPNADARKPIPTSSRAASSSASSSPWR
jgi:peptide/nickel transport system ATP-binding protein